MSLIGTEVKPFTAQAYHNGKFVEITDANFKGKWSVVCFYPADFTFVCPTELEDLQNQYAALQELGVEVYSVSTDTHFTHKAWHDTSDAIKKITYFMIGDPSHVVSRNFEVLIDPDGVIQAVEINAGGIGRDASALFNKIKAAQYIRKNPNEVCPAKWHEGSATLKPSLDLVGKI